MTISEIKRSYEQAKDKKRQISILAQLNDCTEKDIREILGIKAETKKQVNVMELLSAELERVEAQLSELETLRSKIDFELPRLEERYKKIVSSMDVIGELGL